MRSVHRIATALVLAVIATPVVEATMGPKEARAEASPDDLAVGTELLATADLSLHKAEIAKGSRVSVTNRILREGRLDGVKVALPDGHIVKMPLIAVRSYFRVITD